LAGSIRNLRAHFGDQVFLLHSRTRLMIIVAAIDAVLTVVLGAVCIRYWGLVGAAGSTVLAALAATTVSFVIGFSQFGLTLPLRHLVRIGLATLVMAALLGQMPEASSLLALAAHIAAGATVYVAALAAEYAPLLRTFLRPQQSES
jgi:hypothetical protein